MTTTIAREDFIASMQREFPANAQIPDWCRRMMRLGSTSLLYAERECSDEHWCNHNPQRERLVASLARRIAALANELPGVLISHSGDPRGHTVKLVVPSGRSDDWGQTGICVPTS